MFGKSLEIRLDKYQFQVDEKIVGTVTVSVSEITKIKGLYVGLVVTEETKKTDISSVIQGGVSISNSSNTAKTYRFDIPLLGEGMCERGGEYAFEMIIPKEAWPLGVQGVQSTGGIFGGMVGALARLSPLGNKTRSYKIEARLDIPWGIDTTEAVDITIQ